MSIRITLSFPRTWRTIMGKITFAAAALVACAGFEIASAEAAIVVVSKTIQAAVDEANPGDIIVVPPGTYAGPNNAMFNLKQASRDRRS
jgi:hypothetical protein